MYEYNAVLLRIIDGDTVVVQLDMGCDVGLRMTMRLNGIDAPEKNTEEGKAAIAWLESKIPLRASVAVKTFKDKKEKYGRYRADLFLLGDATTLNLQMVEAGHAKLYAGGKR